MAKVFNDTKNTNKELEVKIDEDLYSRQLYVIDHDAMKEMMKKRMIIIGLDGLGQEIAKNICLAGIKSIDLYDKSKVIEEVLESGFYFRKNSVGMMKDKAVLKDLKNLNKYVNIRIVDHVPVENYEIVISVNQDIAWNLQMSNNCRRQNVKFIMAEVRGLFSRVFCDFIEHKVIDSNGEPESKGSLNYIDEDGIATLNEDNFHTLDDGDVVIVDDKIYRVMVLGALQIKLIGYKSDEIRCGGDFEQIKQPIFVKFRSLEECINDEKAEEIVCFDEADKNMYVHRLFNNTFESCENENNALKEVFEQGYEVLITPMCSVIGGFAAQEVIKAATGKFMPLKQFFYFNVDDLMAKEEDAKFSIESNWMETDRRRAGLMNLIGTKAFECLTKMRIFVVGAGAIGCENIKNFVMCGLGKNGMIHITDMDMIEKSNLNRQFLFKASDVGKAKSEAAGRKVIEMDSDYKESIKWHESAVGSQTENIFSDTFMREFDVLVNALDNIEAREYMDERCVLHKIPMFDAGTSGTKGHVQCVIPYLTESYRSSQDPPTKDMPMCTIRLFPSTIEHTINWAVALFKNLFNKKIMRINCYLEETKTSFSQLIKDQMNREKDSSHIMSEHSHNKNIDVDFADEDEFFAEDSDDVEELIKEAPINVELCIKKAISLFVNLFSTTIQNFLNSFPPDTIMRNGVPFWSPPKRVPTPISFNINDKTHVLFIETCANLYASCFKVRKITRNEVFLYLENILSLCEPNPIKFGDDSVEAKILECIDYDKDSWHVDFIYATANIRAKNFGIKEQTKHYIKGVSGQIVPAIATTTTIVSGLVTLEIIKHAIIESKKTENLNKNSPEIDELIYLKEYENNSFKYKNSFLNLGIPFLTRVETVSPKINSYTAHSKKVPYTIWSSINLPDLTIREIIDQLSTIWDQKVSAILNGSTFIYWNTKERYNKNLPLKISELLGKPEGKILQPLSYITEDVYFEAESFNVIFK